MTPGIVDLLTMKANSERKPNVIIKDFFGEAIYHLALITRLKAKFIQSFIINTDSENIKEDAKSSFGEKIILHDQSIAIHGNHVSMNKVF